MKLFLALVLLVNVYADEALEIAKKTYYANQPVDMTQEVEMTLVADGSKSTRKFVSVSKTNNIEDNNSIVQFTEPSKSRGVSLLTKNKKVGDADQYIYLPALKKVRRISSSKKSGRFVGSDVYYEDLQNRHYAKNNYKILKKDKNYAILESTPKDNSSIYSKAIIKIDLNKDLFVESQLYIDGKLDKHVKVKKLKKFGKIWVPTLIEYTNKRIKHSTTLDVKKVKLDKGVNNSIFSKRSIEDKMFAKKHM